MALNHVQMAIEEYIDSSFDSLADVYATMADLCREKADHVRSNWQDEALAHLWDRFGNAADKAREAFEREVRKID